MRLLRNESTENIPIDALRDNMEARAERIMELKIRLAEREGIEKARKTGRRQDIYRK